MLVRRSQPWQVFLVPLAVACCGGPPAAADDAAPRPPVDERYAAEPAAEQPDFRRHVLPLLGRLGCNGRACHGSFQGQGGFQLSLFGYDFAADHQALTSGDEPRAQVAQPAESLLLRKPTLAEEHEGGRRIEPGSWQYRLLHQWVSAGAQRGEPEDVRLERLQVTPAQIMFSRVGETVTLRLVALWSDGSTEDVTPLARFRSNDESITAIDASGQVTAVAPGDTHVVAFYDNGVSPVATLLPLSERWGDRYPRVPTPTRIDELVVDKLRPLGLVPSELCSDGEFLRRASLDLTGLLPSAGEAESFATDPAADKRSRKIDELLARPAHAAWWAIRLCDFTGNNPQALTQNPLDGNRAAAQWYAWIYERLKANVPYDQIVAGIVLATGRQSGQSYEDYCREMSAAYGSESAEGFAGRETMPHYWMRRNTRNPPEMAISFAHAFLGVRLQCAQCHKHPFDQWTKQDFDQFASFFRRVTFGVAPDAREQHKSLKQSFDERSKDREFRRRLPELIAAGKVDVPWQEVFVSSQDRESRRRPEESKPARRPNRRSPGRNQARLLGGAAVDLNAVADPRQPLMDWLRADGERYFARALVNRVWAGYFAVGIVEPPDDLNLANPPSNAPLLDYLTREFVARGYDLKWLHREIVSSRTYQLSCQPNETNALDRRNFSRQVPRRLPAEVAFNAIFQATADDEVAAALAGKPERLATMPALEPVKGPRPNYLLTVFGKPSRATNCDCERSTEPSLLQTLYLRNDQELLGLIERQGSWFRQVSGTLRKNRRGQPPADEQAAAERGEHYAAAVRQAYLRTLSRAPTAAELARALEYVSDSSDATAGVRDVLWALLNTKEFILNH